MATIHLLVLNYNGRRLLEECLPTLLRAAAMSRHDCRVAIIDNASSDDSVELLRRQFPSVRLFLCENRGLCSFNTILPQLESQVVVLLNNDIKLSPESIDPLVAPLLPGAAAEPNCFLTAPLCWLFDGRTYEGLQTALRWRWGLIQAISDYSGHQQVMRTACLTASAGAVMAVDRLKFIELGGFDGLYLPGRIEDLDFCFRGYLAGYHARYVPESVAYHAGEATFRQELGALASHTLALRNTLLFQWKNLRHPCHKLRHLVGLPPRFVADVLRAPFVHRGRRLMFSKAFLAAIRRWRYADSMSTRASHDVRRERQLLKELHWTRFALGTTDRSASAAMREPTLVGFGRLPPALAGGLRRMYSVLSRLQPGFSIAALALAHRVERLKSGARSPAKAGSTMPSGLRKPPAKAGGKAGKPAEAGCDCRRRKIGAASYTPQGQDFAQRLRRSVTTRPTSSYKGAS